MNDIKAVLFDLDGTLLPMNMDLFLKSYFEEISKVMIPLGLTPEESRAHIWSGVKQMVINDGSRRNIDAFWNKFHEKTGLEIETARDITDRFYVNEFNLVKKVAKDNPKALETLKLAGGKDRKVVLASNPMFPMAAQNTRLSWIGLKQEDFSLVTSYETDSYCKPNPKYFETVAQRIGITPENCLMIGNDDEEDMHAASTVGMQTYLITDFRILSKERPWTGAMGTYSEMMEMLKNL